MLEEDRLMVFKGKKEDKGGVSVEKLSGVSEGNMVTPGKRLFLTKDGKGLVEMGHEDAATLFCSDTGSVLRSEYKRLGGKKIKDA